MILEQQQIDNIQIDYGVVYINYGETGEFKLGPTRGGGAFTVTKNIRDIEYDGRLGATKGLQVLDEMNAVLSVPMMDTSLSTLAKIMPYANYDSTTITGDSSVFGVVADTKYIKNVALLAKVIGGGYKLIKLFNAMNQGDFNFTAAPKSEGVINVEFSAHWDPTGSAVNLYTISDVAGLAADTTPPTVVASPGDGVEGFTVHTNLTATFSEQIQVSDINTHNFILIKASTGDVIPGELTFSTTFNRATFNPTDNLENNTDYIWTITNVRDLAGNKMAPKIVNFKTAIA